MTTELDRADAERGPAVAGLVVSGAVLLFLGGVLSYFTWGIFALGVADSGGEWSSSETLRAFLPAIATAIGILVHIIGGIISVCTDSRVWPSIVFGWLTLGIALVAVWSPT